MFHQPAGYYTLHFLLQVTLLMLQVTLLTPTQLHQLVCVSVSHASMLVGTHANGFRHKRPSSKSFQQLSPCSLHTRHPRGPCDSNLVASPLHLRAIQYMLTHPLTHPLTVHACLPACFCCLCPPRHALLCHSVMCVIACVIMKPCYVMFTPSAKKSVNVGKAGGTAGLDDYIYDDAGAGDDYDFM